MERKIKINFEEVTIFNYSRNEFITADRVVISNTTIKEIRDNIEEGDFQCIVNSDTTEVTNKKNFIVINVITENEDVMNKVIEKIKSKNKKFFREDTGVRGIFACTQPRKNASFAKTIFEVESIEIID